MSKRDKYLGLGTWSLGLVGVLLAAFGVEAVTPQIWRENAQAAFEKGEPEAVSLTREGTVTLAPDLRQIVDTGEGFVWALVADAKGTLYIGTGNEGRVFALKPGAEAPDLIYDAPDDVAIFSLAVGADGALYAGASPSGNIIRIAPGNEPSVFCQTGDAHVWALLPRSDGGLWAATGGEQGRILNVSRKGVVEPVYVCDDPNVVSLAQGADGHVYAGTDVNGLIYRVAKDGTVSVLYDAGEKEVHAIAVGKNGTIYATAMADKSASKAQPKDDKGESNGNMSVLYAIRPSGSALRLWEVDDPLLLDVAVDGDGSLRVVTGQKGRVYRVWPDGLATLLAQLKDVQPWGVLPLPKGDLWIGTSGAGELYKLSSAFAHKGTLTSGAHDFALVSHWGRVAWRADVPSGASIVVQTRSGNSETPDKTWSAWSKEIAVSGSQITSPPARFLQYRARLASKSGTTTPQLREVQLSGLQENLPPMVLNVKASPERDGESNDKPKKDGDRGVWKIEWTAGDANGDAVMYALSYRGAGETHWRLLKDDLSATNYLWQTETVPDGIVRVRVVASDRKSNLAAQALTGEAVSAPFIVDNTAPTVRLKTSPRGTRAIAVTGVVEDGASAILSASYALNSGDWVVVFPKDRIFDSPGEALDFAIEDLSPGAYTLVVRAKDALGNIGVGKAVFDVK